MDRKVYKKEENKTQGIKKIGQRKNVLNKRDKVFLRSIKEEINRWWWLATKKNVRNYWTCKKVYKKEESKKHTGNKCWREEKLFRSNKG